MPRYFWAADLMRSFVMLFGDGGFGVEWLFLSNEFKSTANVRWSPGISEVTFSLLSFLFLFFFFILNRGQNHRYLDVMYLRSHCLGETHYLHNFLSSNCNFYLGIHGAPSVLNENQNMPNLQSS